MSNRWFWDWTRFISVLFYYFLIYTHDHGFLAANGTWSGGGSGYAFSFERPGDLQVTTTFLVVLDWSKIQRSMNIVCVYT